MKTHIGLLTLLISSFSNGQAMEIDSPDMGLTLDEVRPVLEILSRLGPVKVIARPSLVAGSLHVCFEEHSALKSLNGDLARYDGNAQWIIASRLPLLCLVAVPKGSTLRSRQIKDRGQLKRLILEDVDPLARFLERELRLIDAPSRGIEVVMGSGNSPQHGPGGPALLVGDPGRLVPGNFAATSPYDETVDFWMSDRELDDLYEILHLSGANSAFDGMDLLKRVTEKTYETLIILPDEVGRLRSQCEAMSRVSRNLKEAMLRVAMICDRAAAHRLGIVVIGG